MQFKQWLPNEDDVRTGAKLGLYPSISDSLGQYPPLYITPHAADFITYYNMEYGKKPLHFLKNGIADPKDMDRHDRHKVKWNLPECNQYCEAKGSMKSPDHVVHVKDEQHIYNLLKQFSLTEGGAWGWHVLAFSDECRFYKYDAPSKIPHTSIDWMRTSEYSNGAIGWKGEIVPFSKHQIIKDQQRGYGRD